MAILTPEKRAEVENVPQNAYDAVAPLPPFAEPPALAAKADDLDSLRTAVVDAASVGGGLWISYLFVLFYLLIAAGSVTHQDLFFETPVKLPFLGVDLPLKGFFWLGPLLFLIVHAYVLLHFAMLSGKVVAFDRALREQIQDGGVRTKLRRQLPSNIFVQFLAGPSDERNGVMGALLWLIALISLVVGPVFLLIFFELQFLPYHNAWITWWQRIAVGIELLLMWMFWGKIALRGTTSPDQDTPRDRIVAGAQGAVTYLIMAALTGVSTVLLLVIATFPGEALEDGFSRLGDLPGHAWLKATRIALVAGDVDPASRQPESLWSNRLVLPGLDVVVHLKLDSDAKIDFLPETVSLRDRNLRGAVLLGAVLRKANFTGADLRDIELRGANLRQAKMGCAYWEDAEQRKHDGKPSEPKCTLLQGASLNFAQFQGASLEGAQLQGASLYRAELQGASLIRAQHQGASLVDAQFQGASLDLAQLQGASSIGAQFQGASLRYAQLQGASLDHAQVQGASFDRAQLQGASLRFVFVWRAGSTSAITTNARIEAVERYQSVRCGDPKGCPWTADTFKQLRDLLTAVVPAGPAREAALKRIDPILNPDAPPFANEEPIAARWNKANTHVPAPTDQEAEIVDQWNTAGCDPVSAPYVVAALAKRMNTRGNIRTANSPFAENSPRAAQLAAAFLDPSCAGNKGLSDADTAILKKLAAPLTASPKPPNSDPANAQGTHP